MSKDQQILHDELKTPVVVFVAALIVFIFGSIYTSNEIIDVLVAILGDLPSYAKLMMHVGTIINVAVMGIVLLGLYRARSWARGAVAFVVSYFLVVLGFDFYYILGLGVKADVIQIAALTNLFCLVLSAYTLYSLFSTEVSYILGKYKIENIGLGIAIGLSVGLYSGIDELEAVKKLQHPDVFIIDIVKAIIFTNYCSHAAVTSMCAKHPNYPTTTTECKAFFEGAFENCRQQLSGTLTSNITVASVEAYMDQFKVCARKELFNRLQ